MSCVLAIWTRVEFEFEIIIMALGLSTVLACEWTGAYAVVLVKVLLAIGWHRLLLHACAHCCDSDVLLNQREVDVRRDRNVERSLLVRLVSRRHDEVAVRVAIKPQLLGVLAPGHELQILLINGVVFCWLNVSRVYIETNHGSDESHSDLFLPGPFGPAERDLN